MQGARNVLFHAQMHCAQVMIEGNLAQAAPSVGATIVSSLAFSAEFPSSWLRWVDAVSQPLVVHECGSEHAPCPAVGSANTLAIGEGLGIGTCRVVLRPRRLLSPWVVRTTTRGSTTRARRTMATTRARTSTTTTATAPAGRELAVVAGRKGSMSSCAGTSCPRPKTSGRATLRTRPT